MRRGDLQRRGQDDIRRGGPGPDRLQQRGTDRSRPGEGGARGDAAERIRLDWNGVVNNDSAGPGVGVARETGGSRAFSSEVDAGSRQENAIK